MIQDCNTPGLLSIDNALAQMFVAVEQQQKPELTERVLLTSALNRVLSKDVISQFDVPPNDNSAMDGYALIAADLEKTDSLKLVGNALAGQSYDNQLQSGECIRIMTGAPIPPGADTVIMQEQVLAEGNNIQFQVKKTKGNNIRLQGESIAIGSKVLEKGTRLNAAQITLLASLGEAEIEVYKLLTVGVMATGDELAMPGQPLKKGHIYESNRTMITALLQQFGATIIDYGIVPDDLNATREAFAKASGECDLVITSGGVSVGEADFVKDILQEIGEVGFWKVAIKPGKPFAFGRLKDAWFCGLPGNPVSSYVTFQQLVLPLLRKMQREEVVEDLIISAVAGSDIRKQPGRKDFQRANYSLSASGEIIAKPNGPQGSGIMTSVSNANCYIVLDAEQGSVKEGEKIKIIPFSKYVS